MDKSKATQWMRNALKYDLDDYNYFGEVNCTKLAENCANELDLYEDDEYTIPELLFDLAVEVSAHGELTC